jgi:hypothetical protein
LHCGKRGEDNKIKHEAKGKTERRSHAEAPPMNPPAVYVLIGAELILVALIVTLALLP